jgi:hypothetical protein
MSALSKVPACLLGSARSHSFLAPRIHGLSSPLGLVPSNLWRWNILCPLQRQSMIGTLSRTSHTLSLFLGNQFALVPVQMVPP